MKSLFLLLLIFFLSVPQSVFSSEPAFFQSHVYGSRAQCQGVAGTREILIDGKEISPFQLGPKTSGFITGYARSASVVAQGDKSFDITLEIGDQEFKGILNQPKEYRQMEFGIEDYVIGSSSASSMEEYCQNIKREEPITIKEVSFDNYLTLAKSHGDERDASDICWEWVDSQKLDLYSKNHNNALLEFKKLGGDYSLSKAVRFYICENDMYTECILNGNSPNNKIHLVPALIHRDPYNYGVVLQSELLRWLNLR